MPDTVIAVENLKKYYKVQQKEPGLIKAISSFFKRNYTEVKAVDGVTFSIGEGELVGFIGPNGAGKTTTLKILSGLLYPTEGKAKVLGFDPWKRNPKFQKQFSLVMGQKNQLWWDLPAIESLILNKEIYEIPDAQFKKTLDELVQLMEVEEILNTQVRKLSLGQRMKMELIAALIHSPKVLFLDEPTIGLDVVMQKKMRDFIKAYNQKFQATIILTSHYMDDVKELCKRVIVIDKGKILFNGKLEQIINKFSKEKLITLTLSKDVNIDGITKYATIEHYLYPKLTVQIKRERVAEITAKLLKEFPIEDLTVEEPQIEDIIREIFQKEQV